MSRPAIGPANDAKSVFGKLREGAKRRPIGSPMSRGGCRGTPKYHRVHGERGFSGQTPLRYRR